MKFTTLALTTLLAFASAAPHKAHQQCDDCGDFASPEYWLGILDFPLLFTSTYSVKATPDQVVNASNAFTGGLPGAEGLYRYGVNSLLDVVCYDIAITGFRGEYQSPAATATHIHQGAVGMNGPPRIAFPNPVDNGKGVRKSKGCLKGPFKTGLPVNGAAGTDTGDGFKVAAIEADPAAFFTDVHSSLAVPGAVRGQLKY